MAAPLPALAYRPARNQRPATIFTHNLLDPDALHRALETADVAAEGAAYAEPEGLIFFGSAIITVRVHEADRLATLLVSDPRAEAVLRARVQREMARLLGPDAPISLTIEAQTQVLDEQIRITCDIEGPVELQAALSQ
jgi:hypothetical protein